MLRTAVLLALLACAGCATTAEARAARFVCADGMSFVLVEQGPTATVRFAERGYPLERRRSSIGRKYASPEATLIVDGDTAVFVAVDRLDLDSCRIVQPGG